MGYTALVWYTLTVCFVVIYGQPGHKELDCDLGKDVIVQFHGWRYEDIEAECRAAQAAYFCAFQVPPPHEHQDYELGDIAVPNNTQHPWWQRYNSISFSLANTDSGVTNDLHSMLSTCNANNVRIIIDMEMNNAGDNRNGTGSAGGYYDGSRNALQYPHFSGQGFFHLENGQPPDGCPTGSGSIEDENDRNQVRYCKRYAVPRESVTQSIPLNDLKTGLQETRDRFLTPINLLLNGNGDASRSVAGFRFAHARWVDPADLRYIANSMDDITASPGVRPFIMSEVLPDGFINETEYYDFGQVEESRAGPLLSDIIKKQHNTYTLANLTLWGPNMGLMNSWDAIVYIDDPALQRGWPERTDVNKVLSFRQERLYQVAHGFMLAHPYGLPRVHSSYNWNRIVLPEGKDVNDWMGPPRTNGVVDSVQVNATGNGCDGDWNCEHRWTTILGMTRFRNFLNQIDAPLVNNYWTNGRHQMAFSRGNSTVNRGFIAMNLEDSQDLVASIYSGMASGTYCDLATGNNVVSCTGRSVVVGTDGRVQVNIPANDPMPFIAIQSITPPSF